jgi:hypothetical protein
VALALLAVYARHAESLGLYVDDWAYLRAASSPLTPALFSHWPADFRPLEILPWFFAVGAFRSFS